MANKDKDVTGLFFGVVVLLVGICILLSGHASLYGVTGITGGQAKVAAVVCIVFSTALIVAYFKKS